MCLVGSPMRGVPIVSNVHHQPGGITEGNELMEFLVVPRKPRGDNDDQSQQCHGRLDSPALPISCNPEHAQITKTGSNDSTDGLLSALTPHRSPNPTQGPLEMYAPGQR